MNVAIRRGQCDAMRLGFIAVLGAIGVFVIGPIGLGQEKSKSAGHERVPKQDKYFTAELKSNAKPKLIPVEARKLSMERDELNKSFSAAEVIELTADCETDPTPSSGIRRDCDSDAQVVTLPEGYYYVEADATTNWEIDRGTDNRSYVEWHDKVEIYPGTRVYVPRTVKFWVHARSPSGPNSGTGRSKVKLTAPYKKLPPPA